MTEIILGVLGGGAAVQLVNTLAMVRQNRRRLNAEALGLEIAALERTIEVLQKNFELENERHRKEVAALRAEIERLRSRMESVGISYEPSINKEL